MFRKGRNRVENICTLRRAVSRSFQRGHFWQRRVRYIRDAALMAASARDRPRQDPAPSCGAVDRTSNWLPQEPANPTRIIRNALSA
jgi:hypothetical protein